MGIIRVEHKGEGGYNCTQEKENKFGAIDELGYIDLKSFPVFHNILHSKIYLFGFLQIII